MDSGVLIKMSLRGCGIKIGELMSANVAMEAAENSSSIKRETLGMTQQAGGGKSLVLVVLRQTNK